MSNLDTQLFAATLRRDLPALDLHGKRVWEAGEAIDLFIFSLIAKKELAGRVIYGFGTGALCEFVLAILRARPEIATLQEQSGACIFILK